MDHAPDCRWERTTLDECDYRATHHYCPHDEHACTCPPKPAVTPEAVAAAFHETYERLAPGFSYKTRDASAVPWEDVPESNRRLMIAVVAELFERGVIRG